MTSRFITALLALTLALPAFTDQQAKQGYLVIVGGGLKADNEPVYRAVLDRIPDGGTLGVLPTASGIPEESGPGHVENFQQYAGPNQKIILLDIRNGDVDKANNPEWVEKIKACDGLWFTGGDQSRIVATFRPDAGDTPAYAAMWDVLNRGGVIGGTSAGAAMMSDPMIKWGNSHEALLLGVVNDVPDFGVGVGKGMGFFPYGITDQHFFVRGRLGRLLVACATLEPALKIGIGVGENSAAVVTLSAHEVQVLGPGGVLRLSVSPQLDFNSEGEKAKYWFGVSKYSHGQSFRLARTLDELKMQILEQPTPRPTHYPSLVELRNWMSGAPRAYEGDPAFQLQSFLWGKGLFPHYAVFQPSVDFISEAKAEAEASLDSERNAEPQDP